MQIAYADGDARAAVIAMRSIAEGDDITLTYTDVDQDTPDRQVDLVHYGFLCACERCKDDA